MEGSAHRPVWIFFFLSGFLVDHRYFCYGWEYESDHPTEFFGSSSPALNGSLYILGNNYNNEYSQEVETFDRFWILDGETLQWRWRQTHGEMPIRRRYYCTSIIQNKLYMFGGRIEPYDIFTNEMYVLDLISLEWKAIKYSSINRPYVVAYMSCNHFQGRIYVYGGYSGYFGILNTDFWAFDIANSKWEKLGPSLHDAVNYPTVYNPNVGLYLDTLFMCSGSNAYYNTNGYYDDSPTMWMYNITKRTWEHPIEMSGTIRSLFSTTIVYGNKMYIFGGMMDGYWTQQSSDITIIDLEKITIEEVARNENAKVIGYPIRSPSPRALSSSFIYKDKWIITGGGYLRSQNDIWIFDTEKKQWSGSSLERYPLGRSSPHMSALSEHEIAIFGGLICPLNVQPINDLWILNTQTKNKWTRLVQESECNPWEVDCAPAVINAAFGFWSNTLFLIGGYYENFNKPIMRQFSLDTNKWSEIVVESSIFYDIGTRYSFSGIFFGSKLMAWGGMRLDGSNVNSDVAVLDVRKLDGYKYSDVINTPILRKNPKAIQMDDSLCFFDSDLSDSPSGLREVWCFVEEEKTWKNMTSIPDFVPDGSITTFDSNIVSFGGTQKSSWNEMWMGNVKSGYWGTVKVNYQMIPRRSLASTVILSNVIYVFGGKKGSLEASNSFFRFDLRKFWCDGHQVVTSKDKIISDGSGDYLYFPGTVCSWLISNTNFLVVEYMNITAGASLNLKQNDDCGNKIFYRKQHSNQISLLDASVGGVVEITSGDFILSFQVENDAKTSDGFSIRLFNCDLGFIARISGCVCESGKFINFRGECMPCADGYTQPDENKHECIPGVNIIKDVPNIINLGKVRQAESVELSSGLPPLLHANAITINDVAYLMGGTSSSYPEKTEYYYDMDIVYHSKLLDLSVWKRSKATGDIPARRLDACLVSVGALGILIGGRTDGPDNYIYSFNSTSTTWTRKLELSTSLIGARCARRDDTIYIIGGMNVDGKQISKVFLYKYATNKYTTKDISANSIRTFGSVFFHKKNVIVFGGTIEGNEPESLVLYNEDFEFEREIVINLQRCTPCDEEGGNCFFGRKDFSFSIYEDELHIFGGVRKGDTLADMIAVDLNSFKVIFRQNYGLVLPELPIKYPPPKYGAAHLAYASKLVMIGGATSQDNVVNDLWVWDAALRTWIDSSVLREPVNRKEAGFVKLAENSFAIFGGSTQYFNEIGVILLSYRSYKCISAKCFDFMTCFILTVNKEMSIWTPLFLGSSHTGPRPRAGAMMSFWESTIHISGGRTSLGVFDERIWMFDLNSRTWEVQIIENDLSPFQRPLNRYGIRSVQTDKKTWMWGGQILPGTNKVEFYSAVIKFDNATLSPNSFYGKTPVRRTYHSLCALDKANITMYGGYGFDGKTLNDMWIYNIDSNVWTEVRYASTDQSPMFSEHTCGEFDGFTILHGVDATERISSSLMIQHGFRTQAITFSENKIRGYESISNHVGGMMNGLMVSFGGTNGYSTTNQVVAYRPGFCSSSPKIIMSILETAVFDDGSGAGMYMEGANCIWILQNATHIFVEKNIRKQDKLEILSLVDINNIQGEPIVSKSFQKNQESYQSSTGFIVRFNSVASNVDSNNKPCSGCEGFSIQHASCPLNGYMNVESKKCVCDLGYSFEKDKCIKDSGSNKSDFITIIGGVIGGFIGILIIIGVAGGLIYRRKMEGAEKKLYGAIDPTELSIGRLLGSGSFGQVFQGEWRGTEVAVKVLLHKQLNEEQINSFKREIGIMVELRHPNIILYMGACFSSDNLCLVCEMMHQGSLYDVLHRDNTISLMQRVQFMSDISKGMQYLHMANPPIIHHDLKSPNVLVDDRYRLKVSDFGLTTIQGSQSKEENPGSLLWLAPEVIGGGEYTAASDVYSFGIIAWEIMSRKDPYYEIENIFAVTTQIIMNELRPAMPQNVPENIHILIKELWNQNPQNRPSFQAASKKISIISDGSKISSTSSFVDMESNNDAPPEGNVCIVSVRVFGSDKIWEDIPESMGDAVLIFNQTVKKLSKRYHGYISQSDGESYVIIFQEAMQGTIFCTEVQIQLNEAEWPSKILQHEYSRSSADGELKGLRIQMGIEYGLCSSDLNEETKKQQYKGKIISRAIWLSKISSGGQILISDTVYQALNENSKAIEIENIIRSITIRKEDSDITIHEVCAKKISKRINLFSTMKEHQLSTDASFVSHYPHAPFADSQNAGTVISKLHEPQNPNLLQPDAIPNLRKVPSELHQNNIREKKEWEIVYEELEVETNPIGSGSFGSVFIATWKGQRVAVKKILSEKRTMDENYIMLLSEVLVYRKLKHRNIVGFIGACIDFSNLAIVMELVENGSLRQLLRNKEINLGEREKLKIIDGVIQGMVYLHSSNPVILHRDLKSANILVTSEFESKICDFGFARMKANNRTMTKCGTVAYQAPEIMGGKRYNEKADVYSFGILVWEVETRLTPYEGKDVLQLQFEVLNGRRPDTSASMNAARLALMRRCWAGDPGTRPSFRDLVITDAPEDIEIDVAL